MRFLTLIVLFSILVFIAAAQDTTKAKPIDKSWIEKKTQLRIGLGWQHSIYAEAGIARLGTSEPLFAITNGYAAIEWTTTIFSAVPKNIYGIKAGYEMSLLGITYDYSAPVIGTEVKYQTDFGKNDFILTPKIGYGFLGMIEIFYGYNISLSGNQFTNVGNQFSIVYNIKRARYILHC